MAAAQASWPRRDVADHHEERCAGCGLELGPGEVVRWASGVGCHPICADPPTRPPAAEVEQLWEDCLPVETSPAALRYLRQRGLHMAALRLDMVRLLRPRYSCPAWARYGSRSWAETGHRLIVPVYDHAGRMRLVRGWRWEDDDRGIVRVHDDWRSRWVAAGQSPKRLAAAGCSVKGLVMAGGRGLEMLRGELPEWYVAPEVVIEEGEPDALAANVRWPDRCVLGIAPGCWCEEVAGRIPGGSSVVIRTDPDDAGNRYAEQIAETLRGRCRIERALRV
jgi:hypothetical protein